MIGRDGERRSGISAQAARHDDDDSIQHYSLISTQSNGSMYFNKILIILSRHTFKEIHLKSCYLTLIILFNITCLHTVKWFQVLQQGAYDMFPEFFRMGI